MLHRMTTLLSTVVVAFVAANALNAVSPAIAQAAESDARAELEAAVAAPRGRVETASSPRSVTTELAALHDVTNSTKTSDRLFTAERPLYVTLIVFLASLGGALVLCGLIGGASISTFDAQSAAQSSAPAQRISRRHSSRAGTTGRDRWQHRRVQRSVEPGFAGQRGASRHPAQWRRWPSGRRQSAPGGPARRPSPGQATRGYRMQLGRSRTACRRRGVSIPSKPPSPTIEAGSSAYRATEASRRDRSGYVRGQT